MKILQKVWMYAIVYMVLSITIEASLIIFGGLKVPEDNSRIAPIILTVAPIVAALITDFRKLHQFLGVTIITALLTIFLAVTIINTTGLATGLIEPILTRFVSGFLGALVTVNIISAHDMEKIA